MADTVLNTTVFDGSKKLITHFNVVSDGTGSTTKIVDVSGLATSPAGKTCTKVRLNKKLHRWKNTLHITHPLALF